MKRKLLYLTLLGVLLFSAFPLWFSFVVSTKDSSAIAEVSLIPGKMLVDNVKRVFDTVPFGQALVNSLIVALSVTASVVLFSTLAGFAFAKLRFRARTALLVTVVATMMVPTQLGIIPLFILMTKLEWHDTLPAVIAPALVNAFGVFFMTQYLTTAVPTELIEAARADGCTTLRIFWHVVLPAARPAAAVLSIISFLTAWNEFFWPLVVLNPENPTVQITLSTLSSGYVADFSLILTGATIAIVPLLVVFTLLGKHIISGIMQGAVKA